MLHRKYEQRVNYFKAKVKNLVSKENARISKENGLKQADINKFNNALLKAYELEVEKYNELLKEEKYAFESAKENNINMLAGLKIVVDKRFQKTVTQFLQGMEPDDKKTTVEKRKVATKKTKTVKAVKK